MIGNRDGRCLLPDYRNFLRFPVEAGLLKERFWFLGS